MTDQPFRPDEPDVEILMDGAWCQGELRQWSVNDKLWSAQVNWRRGRAHLHRHVFPADRIRHEETERSV